MNKVRKEAVPFLIAIGLTFLNFPLVLILYFCFYDFLETGMLIAASIETILLGLSIIYSEVYDRRKEIGAKYKTKGTLTGFKLVNKNGKWMKKPMVKYFVGNEEYETSYSLAIDGIFRNLLIGKKVTVYYDKSHPLKTFIPNNLAFILGGAFTSLGIYIITLL